MSDPAGQPRSDAPQYGPVHRYARLPAEHRPPPATTVAPTPQVPAAPPPAAWGPVARTATERRRDHASWSRRAAGSVIDGVPAWVAAAVVAVGYLPTYVGFVRGELTVPPRYPVVLVGSLLCLVTFGWTAHNRWLRSGRTGQTIGRRVTGTWLVGQATGRPVGPLDAFLRDLLHVLDGLGGVGYLWPLWDDERQTLADKVGQTVVVRTPVPPLTELERQRG